MSRGRFLCILVLMSDVLLVRACVLFKKDRAPLIISGKKKTLLTSHFALKANSVHCKCKCTPPFWICRSCHVCLHHGVLLFPCSKGSLPVPFVNFFDHYDERNDCNKTTRKQLCQRGSQHAHSIRLHSMMYTASERFIRLTAESKNASQDPDGGSHSKTEIALDWWYVAVAQLRAVTYLHW